VPDDLRDLYRKENPSKEFRKACDAISVHYDEKSNSLSVICDKESSIKKASILSEIHFKGLRQKVTLLKRTQELAQQIEVSLFCNILRLIIKKKISFSFFIYFFLF
jgi:fragile X mental retardation protein